MFSKNKGITIQDIDIAQAFMSEFSEQNNQQKKHNSKKKEKTSKKKTPEDKFSKISLHPDIRKKLKEHAKNTGNSINDTINMLLKRCLNINE